jgi:large subunit ribosomal protein L20
MVRVRYVLAAHKRKKRLLKAAKGQFGSRSRDYKQAIKSVIKGMAYAYRDRKNRKSSFRSLWIIRINAACQEAGISYSRFIKGLSDANVNIDRKLMAELAVSAPKVFDELVKIAKEAKPGAKKVTTAKAIRIKHVDKVARTARTKKAVKKT